VSTSLKATARRLLSASRALVPPPDQPDVCPHCGAAGLVDPGDEEHLTLLGWTAEELRALFDALCNGPCPAGTGGWKARVMWCEKCERLVPAGRYRTGWGVKVIGGCTKEEAGPDLWRNYTDSRLVHDVYTYRTTGRWPDDGEAEDEPPADSGPAAAGSAYTDLLVDGDPPPFGEGDSDGR
jgi:hypothetical protein